MDKKIILLLVSLCLTVLSCKKKKHDIVITLNSNQNKVQKLSTDDSIRLLTIAENPTIESHMRAMQLIFGSPKHHIKSIGILVYNGVNELDLFGPKYVLGQSMGVKTNLIAVESGIIKTAQGVEIIPNTTIDNIEELDILIIPGGFKGTLEATYDKKLLQWINEVDKTTVYTGAVCTGGWILGAAGLLNGKKASTNWYKEEMFLRKYGAIPANERYTKDGKYWTSAGVTAGIDMCLAMMKDIYGDKYAQAIMLDMEYDPNPPIIGGSPEKTNWSVNWMMKTMYDWGLNPTLDSLEKINDK